MATTSKQAPSPVDQLRKIRKILNKNWYQGFMVIDEKAGIADDEFLDSPYDPKTCKFCLVGAARHVVNGNALKPLPAKSGVLKALVKALPDQYKPLLDRSVGTKEDTLIDFNDTGAMRHRKNDVLALIDKAINIAKEDLRKAA